MTKKKKKEVPHWRVRYVGTLSSPMLKAEARDMARRFGAKAIQNNITGEVEMIDKPKKAAPKKKAVKAKATPKSAKNK